MTIIDNIKINNIIKSNYIKDAIINNDPIEDKLHVIIVISNPCLYKRRYSLLFDFVKRIERDEENVILYIVELCYGNQKFIVTKKDDPHHLQIRGDVPLWHKENLINIGVKKLLPKNYKAFAWIDADIEFENENWAINTLKILNGSKDIVQLFSHAVDMDKNEYALRIVNSAGYNIEKGNKYIGQGTNYSHPGYAWAITRKAYEKIGGLYDKAILGSGDFIMLLSLLSNGINSVNKNNTEDYINSIKKYEEKIKTLRFGYIPGVIRHYFHGSKVNRKYNDRWKILIDHSYEPSKYVTYNDDGLLITTQEFPQGLKDDILNYFKGRNEDDFF